MLTKNFSSEEFKCGCGCDEGDIDLRLVRKLQEVRDLIDQPIAITSGLRCPAYNQDIGGKEHSAHLYGFAADLAIPDSQYRRRILTYLLPQFNRIGIGPDFIHVDIDATKPKNVMWTY